MPIIVARHHRRVGSAVLPWLLLVSSLAAAATAPTVLLPPPPPDSYRGAPFVFGQGIGFLQTSPVAVTLWRSDGTPAGTVPALQWSPGTSVLGSAGSSVFLEVLTRTGDFRSASSLWTTDGSEAGSRHLADLPESLRVQTGSALVIDGRLFVLVIDSMYRQDLTSLWSSDGTPAGTHAVLDLPGAGGWQLAEAGTRLLILNDERGEVWASDGTLDGTTLVKQFPGEYTEFFVEDGLLYATVHPGVGRWQLWRSDGTAAGTAKLADRHGDGGGYWDHVAGLGERVVYTAYDARGVGSLWARDGRRTVRLATSNQPVVCPPMGRACVQPGLGLDARINGVAFFSGDAGWWATDGTRRHTKAFGTLGSARSWIGDSVDVSGHLFMERGSVSSVSGALVYELWQTDGSEFGTERVADLPGYVNGMLATAGRVFVNSAGGLLAFDVSCGDGAEPGPRIACRLGEIAAWPSCSAGWPAVIAGTRRDALQDLAFRLGFASRRPATPLMARLDATLRGLAKDVRRSATAERLGRDCAAAMGQRIERLRVAARNLAR